MQMKLVSQGGGGGGAREDAHTTWLVLLIKDGRGPAGNYPLISTPLLRAMLTPHQEPLAAPHDPTFSFALTGFFDPLYPTRDLLLQVRRTRMIRK